jgi:hypothetical protein
VVRTQNNTQRMGFTMEFSTALTQLASWLQTSRGQPITFPNGSLYSFYQIHRFDEKELAGLEQQYDIALPIAYRELLLCIGASVLFAKTSNWNNSGIEFKRLDELFKIVSMQTREPLKSFFSDCIPIGRDNDDKKVLAVADVNGLAVLLSADTTNDSWDHFNLESPERWPFKDWIASLFESKMGSGG